MLITIVVPVFNEAASLAGNLPAILAAAEAPGCEFELVAVDDGSTDGSESVLRQLAAQEPRIRPLFFTRNFGKEAAMHAGLTAARGDAAIIIDADLQHPPQLIPRMIQLWQQGVLVVAAVKRQRGNESGLARLHAAMFYRMFRALSGFDIADQCDFKLLDRIVVDTILAFPEKRKFFRGLVDWSGYESARIPFEVADRNGGESRWGFMRLAGYAVNNITSFSSAPLKLVTWLGLLTLLVGAFFGGISLHQKFNGVALDGFTTINLLVIFASGSIMLSLGVIGHYVGRIHDEIKSRPVYLLKPERRTGHEAGPADRHFDTV
jgi:glycosyltransferase involved in cell wall biosynthesis